METLAHYHHASPLLTNARTLTHPSMKLRSHFLFLHQHLTSFNSLRSNSNRRHSRVSCLDTTIVKDMATKSDQAAVKDDVDKKEEEEERESKKSPSPPPEKPEPGDCCGSGCVRCVWDVYYEDLEAYNKLHSSDPNNSKSSC